jgi:prepilin-type N-terminal cleavage/methylation domain-containing protein
MSIDLKRWLRLHGFSLVELMAVLAILALVAGIILPRVIGSDENAKHAACATHKGDVEIQAELWMHNTGIWPAANLSNIGADGNYFPQGLPTCPVDGSSYTIDPLTGRVTGHNH